MNLNFKILWVFVLISQLFAAGYAEASNIKRCSNVAKRCSASLEDGMVGDAIRVIDDRAQIIARGYIVKRVGRNGVIAFTQVIRPVRRGYPVIVEVEKAHQGLNWVAAFEDTK